MDTVDDAFAEMGRDKSTPGQSRQPRRWLNHARLIGGIFAGVVAVAFCVPLSRLFILGTVGGDRFFGGCPTRYWAERLKHGNANVVDKLAQRGKDAIPVLLELLDSPNREVREAAATALSRIAPDCEEAIPALAKALSDEDQLVKMAAVPAKIGVAANNPEILRLLVILSESITTRRIANGSWSSEEELAVARVASALASYGPAAKAAVPFLENWLPLMTNSYEATRCIRDGLRAIDPAAAERIISDRGGDGSDIEKMQFIDGDSTLAGVRHNGNFFFFKNGRWEEQPRLEKGVKDFAVTANDGQRFIALHWSLQGTFITCWPTEKGSSPRLQNGESCREEKRFLQARTALGWSRVGIRLDSSMACS